MAARFPQGTGNLAYRIKPAWASKIHVLYWAVEADKLQRLRSGDTVTSQVTRSASGCTFDATNGVIAGNNSTRFTDSIAGGYGALQENSNFTAVASWWGDVFNSGSSGRIGISSAAATTKGSSFLVGSVVSYALGWFDQAQNGDNSPATPFSNDVVDWMTLAARFDSADAIMRIRAWANGSEFDTKRAVGTISNTSLLGDTARPLYLGDSWTGTGNSKMHFEFAALCGVLSDDDMATITSDPASIIEVAAPSITITPDPSSVSIGSNQTMTITRTVAAPAGGVPYNLTSGTPTTATVPATATILEGNTSVTFTATSVGIGTTVITATNAADSGETDSVTHNVTSVLVKKAKFVVHSDFQSATNITIDVFQAPGAGALTGARLGAASGINAEATLEGGQAVIKVPATSIGATGLSVGTSVRAVFKGTTSASSPLGNAVEGGSVATATGSIIEE